MVAVATALALAASLTLAPSPAAAASTVTASVTPNVIAYGQTINVKGQMSPVFPSSRVAIERRLPGNVWSTRTIGTSDAAGKFSIPITPTGSGIYALRVRTRAGYSPIFYLRVLGRFQLDPGGLDTLRLGMTLAQAKATRWVTGEQAGCELTDSTGAVFPSSIKANATFDGGKISSITVREGGSTVEGLKVGGSRASISAIYRAPWSVRFDDSQVGTFGVVFVAIAKGGKVQYSATVDPDSSKVLDISIPTTPICE